VVLLVPTKYEVYAPLLKKPPPAPAVSRLDRLEAKLRERGVRVVNLGPVFEARAADELAHGRTLYWKDDTHWGPVGIDLAASEIAKAWPSLTR
jgi:hypothetical protein